MWELLRTVTRSSISALRTRRDLALENLALRHQLAVLRRASHKPRLENRDRLLWIGLMRLWPDWNQVIQLVQPATVVKWHRAGFRHYWRRKSQPTNGRPRIDPELRKLIRNMWSTNPTWGKRRIQSELAKLGISVSDSTVARYRPRGRTPPSQTWRTFLDNHTRDIAAIDFFTVPTATFRILYVLLIMSHDRRQILHINVTESPSSTWIAQQLRETFPYDTAPRYLLRDNDKKFLGDVTRCIDALGIEEVTTAPRSPWQNPYCERLIGSIRRECTDHLIILSEHHLRSILRDYVAYYHKSRTHQSLDNDCPLPRAIEPPEAGDVIALPKVGGLHHRYQRQLAA